MYTSLGAGAIGIEESFPRVAELAAAHGFDAVQVDLGYLAENGPAAYRELLEGHDLRTGSAGLPVAFEGDSDAFRDDLESLEGIAPNLADIGCHRVSTYILPFSEERTYQERFDFLAERLGHVVDILADHEISLGLEFIGPATSRSGHAYEFAHDIEGMLELCEAIDPDATGLLLDCWHWYTAGDSIETLQSLTASDVVDVHVNDAPRDVPRTEQIDSIRRMPGETGVIDIVAFLQALENMEYQGPVMAEPFSDELEELDPDEAADRTAASLERIFDQAGISIQE